MYVLIDMLMNAKHIHEHDASNDEIIAHDDVKPADIAAGLHALIEHMPLEYAIERAIIAYDSHDGQ